MTFYYPITVKPTAEDCDKHGNVNLVYIYHTAPSQPVLSYSLYIELVYGCNELKLTTVMVALVQQLLDGIPTRIL